MQILKYLFKLSLSFLLAFLVAVAVGALVASNGANEIKIILVAAIIGISSLVFFLRYFLKNSSPSKAIVSDIESFRKTRDAIKADIDGKDDNLYAQAEKEIVEGIINQGMWSRALVNAKGIEDLRKVEYMQLRVRQLKEQSSDSPTPK